MTSTSQSLTKKLNFREESQTLVKITGIQTSASCMVPELASHQNKTYEVVLKFDTKRKPSSLRAPGKAWSWYFWLKYHLRR